MRFDMRRPDLPGSRMALPPPPSLLRMTPRPVQAQPPAQMVVYGGQPVPRPAAASLPLGAPQVPPASFNVPPPQRQFPPGIPPTSPPVLGLPQQHQHQPPGVLVVHRQPPPTQHPLPSRPPHLTVPMAGPVSVHGPPSAVIPLAVPHVSGPLPPAETRWPTSHNAFNPLLPPPASAVSAPQYLARLPPPPTAADVGGAVHMAATGPPPLNIVHAVPLNYNIPPPAVPVAASAGHLSYMTVAQAVSSAPASANMVTAQYTDVYGRQQTYEYESVGHVQAVQAPPSADRSSPRQSASTYRDSSSYYEPVPEHRHKRRAASSPDRNSDRDMPATTQQSVERSDRSPKKPKPERQLSSLTDKEFDDILQRNKSVSSGAIMRAVQDASAGDFALAIETLVTAISLIKQSKIAADDRCKILISSLQDTLHGIESKSYGSKVTNRQSSSDRRSRSRERERSRERNRERSSTQKSSSSRHMSRSDEYRSSGSAAAEPRESRHHDTLASSASSSSSFERHRVSDKMERDRGDRGSEHNVREMRESRESRESRDIRETRDRDRDRDRDVEGDYISRSSRR